MNIDPRVPQLLQATASNLQIARNSIFRSTFTVEQRNQLQGMMSAVETLYNAVDLLHQSLRRVQAASR